MSVNVHLPLQGNAAGVRGGVGREEGGGGAKGAFICVRHTSGGVATMEFCVTVVDPVQWECDRDWLREPV
jgi:hypothetical protein